MDGVHVEESAPSARGGWWCRPSQTGGGGWPHGSRQHTASGAAPAAGEGSSATLVAAPARPEGGGRGRRAGSSTTTTTVMSGARGPPNPTVGWQVGRGVHRGDRSKTDVVPRQAIKTDAQLNFKSQTSIQIFNFFFNLAIWVKLHWDGQKHQVLSWQLIFSPKYLISQV